MTYQCLSIDLSEEKRLILEEDEVDPVQKPDTDDDDETDENTDSDDDTDEDDDEDDEEEDDKSIL